RRLGDQAGPRRHWPVRPDRLRGEPRHSVARQLSDYGHCGRRGRPTNRDVPGGLVGRWQVSTFEGLHLRRFVTGNPNVRTCKPSNMRTVRMAPKPWKTLSSRPIYANKWTRLREDVAELPDGRTTIYGVVTFGQCVGVLPFLDGDRVLMVRQYRYV